MELAFQHLSAFLVQVKDFLAFDSARLAEGDMIFRLSIQVCLLFGSAFFSGSEIALVSADKIQMHHRARVGDKGAKLFLKMFRRPDRLLPLLWERRDQSAIIVDEFGSAMGMLSLEDILGVVVGDVKTGYHFEKHPYKHERTFEVLEEDVYVLDARLPISEVNDVVGLNLSAGTYRTVGGMLLTRLRHVPKEGEYIVDSGYRFTIVEATPKAATKVRAEPEA